MSGLLFSCAFLAVAALLLIRGGQRLWRRGRQTDHHVVARFDDIDNVVAKVRCVCGRRPDKDGEGPRPQGSWGVEFSCVCGRRRSLIFIVGN